MIAEAKVEALQDHFHRIESNREDSLQLAATHRQEAQRLAAQIQAISREKADASALPAVENLERKLGVWLTDWQKSLHVRLEDRDRELTEQVRADISGLREGIEKRLSKLEVEGSTAIDERLKKIGEAARALAESVSSFSTPAPPQV
jgi:hypothetical protein